jgi:hypothetical protein
MRVRSADFSGLRRLPLGGLLPVVFENFNPGCFVVTSSWWKTKPCWSSRLFALREGDHLESGLVASGGGGGDVAVSTRIFWRELERCQPASVVGLELG